MVPPPPPPNPSPKKQLVRLKKSSLVGFKKKGLNQTDKPLEEDQNNIKNKLKLPLNGPGHYMNMWKVMQAQENHMKETWS